MEGDPAARAREAAEAVYRSESRRVLATLVRLLGDFDLAEEALHDAFAEALAAWPGKGVPDNPRAWLVAVGRRRAVDALRRRSRFDASLGRIAARVEAAPAAEAEDAAVPDDRLRLVFTCCHPVVPPEARIALTLREVCGLTTEEIARAFLSTPSATAQRIVRAKARIRDAGVPFEVPSGAEMPGRLDAVLRVLYLVFNEGYAASSGPSLVRPDLSREAIRLARLLADLLPDPEAEGLLALMLLQDSRRAARTTAAGDIVLLDEQDRSLWDRAAAAEGIALVERALRSRRFGPYAIQAAVAAVHAEAADAASTDWAQIAGLYDLLARVDPSPVVARHPPGGGGPRGRPAAGGGGVGGLLARGLLEDYLPAHATRADLCRRLGRTEEARASWLRALALARQEPERRFIEGRIAGSSPPG